MNGSGPQPAPGVVYENWLTGAIRVATSNLWLVILVVAIATGGAVLATLAQPTTYTSTVTIVVQTSSQSNSETLTRTMAALLGSEAIGAGVQSESGVSLTPKQIADRISVARPPGSGVLTVRVTDTDLQRSRDIASAVPPVFASRVERQLRPGEAGELGYFVRSWDADPSTTSNPPPVARNGALGVVVGLAVAGLVVAARERLLPVVRSPQQLESALGVPVVASVPDLGKHGGDERMLQGVQELLGGAGSAGWPATARTILVTGPKSSAEKSTLATWVATAVASIGTSVILVDADVDERRLSGQLTPGASGLTDCLAGKTSLEEAIVQLKTPPVASAGKRLWFLPAGNGPRAAAVRPGELSSLLSRLARSHFVVIDGPNLLAAAPLAAALDEVDAILATAGDGSSLSTVSEAGRVLQAWRTTPAMAVLSGTRRLQNFVPPTGAYWFSQNGRPESRQGREASEGDDVIEVVEEADGASAAGPPDAPDVPANGGKSRGRASAKTKPATVTPAARRRRAQPAKGGSTPSRAAKKPGGRRQAKPKGSTT